MRDYDYMVTIDRNGEPVICHAGLFGGGNKKGSQKENHKYLARIVDKGKYLYFYTKQELDNYYNRGKKAVEDTAKKAADKTGLSARKELQEANESKGLFAGRRQRKAQEAYDNTALGKAENAVRGAAGNVRDAAGNLGSRARNAAGNLGDKARGAVDSAKDRLGFDERERLENANMFNKGKRQREYDNTALGKLDNATRNAREKAGDLASSVRERGGRTLDSLGNKARGAVDSAKDRLGFDERERLENANMFNKGKRQREYDNTALGKLDNATRNAREKASEFGSGIKSRAERMRDDIRKGAEDAADKARDTAGNITGSNQKKEVERARQNALMGLDDAIGAYYDAQDAYNNTPGGKASNASKAAKKKLDKARESAQGALEEARQFLSGDQLSEFTNLFRRK